MLDAYKAAFAPHRGLHIQTLQSWVAIILDFLNAITQGVSVGAHHNAMLGGQVRQVRQGSQNGLSVAIPCVL